MTGSAGALGAPRGVSRTRSGLVAALFGLCVAGCSSVPQGPIPIAATRGPTVAFESIDGPPESIFRKLVQNLNDEATARQVAVVSRDATAQFRVRGYVAALVEKRRQTIAWVWDVYDAEQRRVIRLTGEEPAGASGRGTWAAADDALVRRIARNGMDRLVAFLAASPGATPPAIPAERGPMVAATDEATPDSDRVSRVVTAAAAPRAGEPDTPEPPARRNEAALAFSDR